MKRVAFWTIAAVLLFSTLSLQASFAQTASQKPMAPNAAQRANPPMDPEIHAAMKALQEAKHHLEGAQHDFGGHRVKALEHVNQALDELREAMNWQKEHPE